MIKAPRPEDLLAFGSEEADSAALQALLDANPACVLSFNAQDATGAGGLAGDAVTMAGLGTHALPVCTGVYIRDTLRTHDVAALDAEAIDDQATRVLEDIPIDAIKVGFACSAENLRVVAEILSDYDGVPVLAYMPDLSWWEDSEIEDYWDAFADLILSQSDILVGNYEVLRRWLLPDWPHDAPPTPRDIAKAAQSFGTELVCITGLGDAHHAENILTSADSQMAHATSDRVSLQYLGAGEALSAALISLLAQDYAVEDAFAESIDYLEQALSGGFQPGMGSFLPDRLFELPSDEAALDEAIPHHTHLN